MMRGAQQAGQDGGRIALGLGGWARAAARWAAVGGALLYAAFAISVAAGTALDIPALEGMKVRAVPPLFVLHAFVGATALGGGAVQLLFAGRWSTLRRELHRGLGWLYVVAALTTALAGLGVSARFDVGLAAHVVFAFEALAWAGVTLVAVAHARRGRFIAHRRWMIRSYALTLFFVTFSFVHPAVEGLGWSRTAGYALAVSVSVAVNVVAAEGWLRRRTAPLADES